MTLNAMFQEGLADLIAEIGGVAVVIDGTSGTGLAPSEKPTTDFTQNGETGVTRGTVRVSGATFIRPASGATILVNGNSCVVDDVQDTSGILTIQYRKVREVEGL